MSEKMAKYFIAAAVFFLGVGCIEGLMFPTKFQLQSLYALLFHVPPEQMKSFFGLFAAKIHTHVNLIGWVGSALMGLLYYIAPRISKTESYIPWVAYANWGCHILGVIVLAVGFHLIGSYGLSSGFLPGSAEFRKVVAPFHGLVSAGGCLITASALLFACNILRTLFLKQAGSAVSEGKAGSRRFQVKRTVSAVAAALALVTAVSAQQAAASPPPVPKRADVIMIGDRLVDVAYNLGVVPAAMSVRCSMWPLCKTLQPTVQVLGCPNCLLKKKAAPLLKAAGQYGIRRVMIEKSARFCEYMPTLQLEQFAAILEGKGFDIDFVDFTQGLEDAVRQTAALLGCPEKAGDVLVRYRRALQETRNKITGKQFVKKVIIIRGTYQAETGKTFLGIEASGGYADRLLLQPMGIENVGDKVCPVGEKPSKGHVLVRKLEALTAAAPDAIVMTGDAIAVQKAIAGALIKYPALADVPAIKAHAVYSLPAYIDASVIEYPQILRRWADVLAR